MSSSTPPSTPPLIPDALRRSSKVGIAAPTSFNLLMSPDKQIRLAEEVEDDVSQLRAEVEGFQKLLDKLQAMRDKVEIKRSTVERAYYASGSKPQHCLPGGAGGSAGGPNKVPGYAKRMHLEDGEWTDY